MNTNVDISNAVTLQCSNCDGILFKQSLLLKKLSRIMTGAPQDTLIPIQVFLCEQCGALVPELLPVDIQNELFSDGENDKKESSTGEIISSS